MIGDRAGRSWYWVPSDPYPRRHRDCGAPLVIDHGQPPRYLCTECDARQLILEHGYRFTRVFPKPELVDDAGRSTVRMVTA